MFLDQPAPEGFVWWGWVFVNHHGQTVQQQPVLLAPQGLLGFGTSDIAPNEEYYFRSDYVRYDNPSDDTPSGDRGSWFWERGRPMPWRLQPGMLIAKFSPDSRWLVGFSDENRGFYVVECRTRKVRKLFGPKTTKFLPPLELAYSSGSAYSWGWYPDSRHIWYVDTEALREVMAEKKPLWHAPIFKADICTGKHWLLPLRERRAVYESWDLLNSRYRHKSIISTDNRILSYSPDRRVRAWADPAIGEKYPISAGVAKVVVEWRSGQSLLVVKPGEHQWVDVVPWDVTNDGRWVLLGCNKVCPAAARWPFAGEVVLIDTRSGHRYVYLDAKCDSAMWRTVVQGGWGEWYVVK